MIVVTGAKGVVGRAVVLRLSAGGTDVCAVSRDVFDLSDEGDLTSFVMGAPSCVIHLAAAVPHSLHYPDTEMSAALTRRIDRCVFDAARAWGCRVVYASTCSLYDKRSKETMTEDAPVLVRPDSPYMKAKCDGEALFAQLPSFAIMRVPAPLGPALPKTVVAQRFFDAALAGQPVRVWGEGRREQNYVDVRDIADAMIGAASSEWNGLINIAADKPTTMLSLATAIVDVIGRGSVELAGVPDPLEWECTRYSNQRALDLLGWAPRISLEAAIRSMCEAK